MKKGFGKTEAYGEKKDEDGFGRTEAYGEKRTRMVLAELKLTEKEDGFGKSEA